MSGFVAVGYFLVSTLFGFVAFLLWLRVGLQYFRISSLHPIRQASAKLTDPLIVPLAKFVHIRPGRQQRIDWLSLGVLVIVIGTKYFLLNQLHFGQSSSWGLVTIYTLAELITAPCDILFYAVLLRLLIGWVNPHWQHPIRSLVWSITEPLLKTAAHYLPKRMAGIDYFIVLILLKAITLFVSASIT